MTKQRVEQSACSSIKSRCLCIVPMSLKSLLSLLYLFPITPRPDAIRIFLAAKTVWLLAYCSHILLSLVPVCSFLPFLPLAIPCAVTAAVITPTLLFANIACLPSLLLSHPFITGLPSVVLSPSVFSCLFWVPVRTNRDPTHQRHRKSCFWIKVCSSFLLLFPKTFQPCYMLARIFLICASSVLSSCSVLFLFR